VIPGSVGHFLDHPEFRTGVAAGAGLAALGLALGLVAIELRRAPAPVGGVLVAIAFVLGVRQPPHLPVAIPIALALLAAAGLVAGLLARRRPPLAMCGVALAVPGAVVLALHLRVASAHVHAPAAWVAPLVAVSIVVAGPLVADFDRRFGARGWPLVLYAISAVGVFSTVPDTERALVLLGLSLPMVFAGWPFALASLGPAGSYAAVGVLVWVSATDGRGRQAAIIGAIACLGLLVIEPIARLLRGGRATAIEALSLSIWAVLAVAGVQLALVFVAGRIAGLQHATGTAALIVALEIVVSVSVLARYNAPERFPVAEPEEID
jgi:hypothetical protein